MQLVEISLYLNYYSCAINQKISLRNKKKYLIEINFTSKFTMQHIFVLFLSSTTRSDQREISIPLGRYFTQLWENIRLNQYLLVCSTNFLTNWFICFSRQLNFEHFHVEFKACCLVGVQIHVLMLESIWLRNESRKELSLSLCNFSEL